MYLVTLSWCSMFALSVNSMFPQIKFIHILYGILTTLCTACINYYIAKIGVEKYKIEYIQADKRGSSIVDKDLYKTYVPVSIFGTLFFAAWPWAIIPELQNISWSNITLFNTVGSYLISMLLYDFIYYLGHRIMHQDQIYYKHIHKVHHQLSSPGNMMDNLYIHPLELFIFLWLQVIPMYIVPIHIIGVIMYFFSIFAVTSMYHVGIKFPSVLPLLSPKFHDDHHKLNNVNYSFFTEIPDIFFNTNNKKCLQ